jgi:hypothetical protein
MRAISERLEDNSVPRRGAVDQWEALKEFPLPESAMVTL